MAQRMGVRLVRRDELNVPAVWAVALLALLILLVSLFSQAPR